MVREMQILHVGKLAKMRAGLIVYLPVRVHRKLGWKPGDLVVVSVDGGKVILEKVEEK